MRLFYNFRGSLYQFETLMAHNLEKQTEAESVEKAVNNIVYQCKMENNLVANSKLSISGKLIEKHKQFSVVYSLDKNKVITRTFRDNVKNVIVKDKDNIELEKVPEFDSIEDVYVYLKIKTAKVNNISELIDLLDNMNYDYEIYYNHTRVTKGQIRLENNKLLYNNQYYVIEGDEIVPEQLNMFSQDRIVFR